MKVKQKVLFWVFRVLGKVSFEVQGFQGPLDSFQCFRGPLDTLKLQDKLVSYFHSKSTVIFITFWDFLMFYQILLSLQVKQSGIISNKRGTYGLSHELPNNLRLRILRN